MIELPTEGSIVHVNAWWLKGKTQRCEVRKSYSPTWIDVQPLEGNPHMRSIKLDAITRVEYVPTTRRPV